jgi:hypothetical protein
MAIRQNIHTLSSSEATLVSPAGVHAGTDITIQNLSSDAYVLIGNSDVSAQEFGYRINPGSAWSVELSGKDAIYATTDVDGTSAAVIMLGLESGN